MLSLDLDDPEAFPYFLWDDPMTVAELELRLQNASSTERTRLLGKILREARDTDVWRFVSPMEVSKLWPQLSRHLGRRRPFWEFLLDQWREAGLLQRGDETVVQDRVPQAVPHKRKVGEICLDVPEEILANKLCSLLSRAEVRDLVDVFALEKAGYRVEDAIGMAMGKDGGLTPAQLSWVLSQISVEEGATIPGGIPISDLVDYLADLISRLAKMAFPAEDKNP